MSNHRFDRFTLKRWQEDKEKINEDEIMKALSELEDKRMIDIILSHDIENKTFREIAKEQKLCHQRCWQLYDAGMAEIRKKIGR